MKIGIKILPKQNSDSLAVKNMTRIAIQILQGTAVTQNALRELIIGLFCKFPVVLSQKL